MTRSLDRAHFLIQQDRFEQAAKELRIALVSDPDDAMAHALLAMCLSELKQPFDAMGEADAAVQLEPTLPFAHYTRGFVLQNQSRNREAEAALKEACRLDPHNADQFALLAQICINQRRWREALGS